MQGWRCTAAELYSGNEGNALGLGIQRVDCAARRTCRISYQFQLPGAFIAGIIVGNRGDHGAAPGNVVVTGDHRYTADLRIRRDQDIVNVHGIRRGAQGFLFHNETVFRNAVGQEPARHFSRFADAADTGGFSAGDRHIGVGIFFSRTQGHFQPVDQLRFHGAIAVQTIAQNHNAHGIIPRQAVGKHVFVHRHFGVDPLPAVHDLLPGLSLRRVNGGNLGEHVVDVFLCLVLIVLVIADHALDIGLDGFHIRRADGQAHGRNQNKRQYGE